jgi:hypothetical protein
MNPVPPPNECYFTLTDLQEANGDPGPGDQYGKRRLLIGCSNIQYNFDPVNSETKDGPKIFSIYSDMVSVLALYKRYKKNYGYYTLAGKKELKKKE